MAFGAQLVTNGVVCGWVVEGGTDLAADVSFQASDGIAVSESLAASPVKVGHRAGFEVTQAKQHDSVRGVDCLPVPAAG